MSTRLIFLDEIDYDLSPKVRAAINDDVVNDYSDRYARKEKMPPVHVFIEKKGKTILLADGAHRCHAKAQLGQKGIEAEVHEGGYAEALTFALTANSRHGLPRTNADKRTCVRQALKQWPESTNTHLAKMCDVDDHTIATVREEMEQAKAIKPAEARATKDGRTIPPKNTPRAIRKSGLLPPKAPPIEEIRPVMDATGTEIPRAIIKYWDRSQEVKDILSTLSGIMGILKKAQEDEDLQFAECNISATLGDLDKAWTAIQCAIPYAVCTQCSGHPEIQPKGQCRLCLGRGMISKFRYDRLVPDELKKIRGKK